MTTQIGRVYFVGGGPGDPGLITLRGCECLARADVVLYDYLINPQILSHAAASAELVCLGRHGHGRIMRQAEINARLIELARAGKTVVRLKGGDPAVFARAAEETHALDAASIPYETVPGITAALASGAYAGIPLTHRDQASAVALVAGQERGDKTESTIDYRALAQFPGTLVFYMGVTTAREWTGELIAAGMAANTPAAIVRRVSWPDQQTFLCTLGTLAAEVEARRLRPPALMIVGQVASLAQETNWFVERPLFGVRVLVTRAEHQAGDLAKRLNELGAQVLFQPAIEISPPDDCGPLDAALARIRQFDWLVFSSANGVRAVMDRVMAKGDTRVLAGTRLAAIGPGSAEALAQYHLRADLIPKSYRAEALARELRDYAAQGERFLLARANRGREVLAEELAAAGGHVEQVVVYHSRDVAEVDADVAAALEAGTVDWITVTSSAIARSLARMFGKSLQQTRLASISPLTTATLGELGYRVTAEATHYTMDGVAAAICRAQAEAGR